MEVEEEEEGVVEEKGKKVEEKEKKVEVKGVKRPPRAKRNWEEKVAAATKGKGLQVRGKLEEED